MNHADIETGHILRLKPERQEAYGMQSSDVVVDSIVPRKGYSVPWIGSVVYDADRKPQTAWFKPSDFAKRVA